MSIEYFANDFASEKPQMNANPCNFNRTDFISEYRGVNLKCRQLLP